MMMFAGGCAIISFFTLQETYAPLLLAQRAKKLRKESEANAQLYAEHERQDWSIMGVLHRTLFRPFTMLAKEPILLLVTIYMSIIYGLLYALFQVRLPWLLFSPLSSSHCVSGIPCYLHHSPRTFHQ